MSATDTEQVEEPATDEEDDRPEIEEDERADISLDDLDIDPEAVEEEAGAGADDSEESADAEAEGDTPDSAGADESAQQAALPDGETWGDQYVDMLALVLGEIAEQSDGEPGKTAEDIENLARAPPVELDRNVDRWLEQAGMGTDIPPGKAVAVGTLGLVAVVLLTETDVANSLMDDLDTDLF
ncbi:hypothetical protein VB773_01480 [Haloarculaceae archaeon H-GB2-1]|nr:hypothetical protein [Haloarculaceae archaeon H-GB1-1]MEA5406385.1 hypothetical protein [Haloarculaceae archaeon H-GB2-1]